MKQYIDWSTKPVHKTAKRFAGLLRIELGAAQFAEVKRLNGVQADKSICHSHDFCDANVAMADAIREICGVDGRRLDLRDADAQEFWNDAWREAKAKYLTATS